MNSYYPDKTLTKKIASTDFKFFSTFHIWLKLFLDIRTDISFVNIDLSAG